ncbi:hypothetical protein Ade02nite_69360 [Paractinoplanes deccanensis]|uniref:Class F sortase n=1 Tax=Paractinoplanes deccanensis TaxID=113561 RepID=A0ABQ3YED5_9ACTN|nr:class F sortase [Actinoplanes deccanensis]GID78295.1 hypothetical protein Ade02nite_69360 [Actinoplanes deccanensis]
MTRTHIGGRRAAGWTALAAGLSASAAGVVLAVQPAPPPADAGPLRVTIAAPASSAPAESGPAETQPAETRPTETRPAETVPAETRPADTGPAPSEPARPGTAKATPPIPPAWAPPTNVTIGAQRIDAPVSAVGVHPDGSLAVPEDPARLGWWIGSATPGSARGTVLIAGHVDTAEDGPGALFRLETLPLGATVGVRAGDRVVPYRVVARRGYPKQRLPADLFRADTAPRLALVTCGGSFRDGAYSHNVVVYAEPAKGS